MNKLEDNEQNCFTLFLSFQCTSCQFVNMETTTKVHTQKKLIELDIGLKYEDRKAVLGSRHGLHILWREGHIGAGDLGM